MKYFLLLVCITLHISSGAQEKVDTPTIAFKVPLGQTIERGDVTITLAEILEDSRCPSDVTCVWAGRAKVKVIVLIDGKQNEERVVLFERGKQTTLAVTETVIFKAIKLSPYPTSATKDKMEYELLVSETIKISEE